MEDVLGSQAGVPPGFDAETAGNDQEVCPWPSWRLLKADSSKRLNSSSQSKVGALNDEGTIV